MASLVLSDNDTSVLQALFDPEAVITSGVKIDTCKSGTYAPNRMERIAQEERAALRLIDRASPSGEVVEETISRLDSIIALNPLCASAWNNRAQARRLLYDVRDLPEHPVELRSIIADLARAILLATPSSPAEAVSPMQAKVLASAHTHRGYLLWHASRSQRPDEWKESIEGMSEMSVNQLEEMASKEFFLGGRYGNSTAQQLAVKTNPYAKLCGSIVKEALQREMSSKPRISIYENV
jgi:hypothetical protein